MKRKPHHNFVPGKRENNPHENNKLTTREYLELLHKMLTIPEGTKK